MFEGTGTSLSLVSVAQQTQRTRDSFDSKCRLVGENRIVNSRPFRIKGCIKHIL